jgi:hypothetical protein
MTENEFKQVVAALQATCEHKDLQGCGWGHLCWYRCRECGAVVENPKPVVIHKPMIVPTGN